MKTSEAWKAFKRIAATWGNLTVTDELHRTVCRNLERYSAAAVDKAIDQHHRDHQFINWQQFYNGCEAAEAGQTEGEHAKKMSFADIVRRQWPKVSERTDAEVILRYWRADWWEYKSAADRRWAEMEEKLEQHKAEEEKLKAITAAMERHEQQRSGYQTKCIRSCTIGLLTHGFASGSDEEREADCERWARTILDEPSHFQLVLNELRGGLVPGERSDESDPLLRYRASQAVRQPGADAPRETAV